MTTPDPALYTAVVFGIFAAIAIIGVVTKRAVDRGDLKLPRQERPAPKYALVECDCGPDTPCPQGRDPAVNPYRCKVQKIVYESAITRTGHGVLE